MSCEINTKTCIANPNKINIAFAGGPCTGKTTTACMLFAILKAKGYDFDLVLEESRKLRKEFGHFRSIWERFYMWRQQEREELRSTASNGFITDIPLFHFYVQSRMHIEEPRDMMAVRELFRMCLEIEQRYQLIVIAKNPDEIPYKTDQSRSGNKQNSLTKHTLTTTFVEHFLHDKVLYVTGSTEERVQQIIDKIQSMIKIS